MSNEAAGQRGEPLFYEWSGTPFEIGLQHGRALGDAIRHEYQPALASGAQSLGVSQEELLERFAARYLGVFQQYAPSAVEEMRGLAQGADLSFEHAFFAGARDGARLPFPSAPEDCTTFFCAAATTADRVSLLGQNKDTNAPLTRYRIMRYEYSDGRRAVLLNYPGWIANIGLNSHGVSCSANSLYARPANKPTVPYSLLRRVINEAESVAHVVAVAQEITLENCCMVVADRSGAAISVEYAGGKRHIEEVSGRAFAHANSILCADLKALEAEKLGPPSSPLRQRNADRLLDKNKGCLSVEALQKIMADHSDYPYSLCRHVADDDPICTTASFVADLSSLQMHIAIGHACVSQWHTYQV